MFVIDASVTLAWCFADEATPGAESVLDHFSEDEAVVPAIWPLEIANVLLVAQRRKRLTEAQASRFSDLLQQLPIHVVDAPTDLADVVAAGRHHELSSYDAAYLVLAERTGAPLATLDHRLADAATRAGVRLLISG
ncbi:MAG TPA: type II toxin-antitoxin system VapC family toxin [Jatrophihabitans sp.]|uniref:type II toxin-antitoxin system VapC family toxin n=1 Tax=Jatrophihabitans sp. TaxID=1932789 RepID=UPI002EE8639D